MSTRNTSAASPASSAPAPAREPIAIIGIGCNLPGDARSPERFWELLRNGVDAVTEIPPERFNIDDFYHPVEGTPGKTHTRYGAFVKGITDFDPLLAGVAPKSAMFLDPQHRLFANACWNALEDAGIPHLSLDGSSTGVFVGMWSVEYWHRLASRRMEELKGEVVGGNLHSMASGAVSYWLGLRGPSISLDTACSSSLVAVDLAVQSLRGGGCDLALAGGVNIILGPENFVCFSGLQVLSPDGRCKTFDAAADGFGRGEGAGAVVLKRLSDALRDGDRIQAVIYGSGVTQDGKTPGIAVPNQEAQADAARRALRQTGISPADVDYAEAHGTGTAVGDPIEVRALAEVYAKGRAKDQPLLLGTVKTNIGHLESAAGIASLIKVVLALQHEALPPNLHFSNPNPRIPWDEFPLKVVTSLTPWPRGKRPRYAVLNSFGVSGTNAHLVVGEAPLVERAAARHPERPRHVLVLTAREPEALRRMAGEYAQSFARHPQIDVADACFTAATGRSSFRERLAVVGTTAEDLRGRLEAFAEGKAPTGLVTGKAPKSDRPRVGFLFTGQGSQYPQMGRGLYEAQPAFRSAMDTCDEILRPILSRRILDIIYPQTGQESPLDDTTFAQPALFALEYAVCQMWKSWGVEPDFVIGHSSGEDVAACIAGVFNLEDGLRLIAERGRLMGALPRTGSMVAILASESRVAPALSARANEVSIASINGPENVVISGRTEAVDEIARAFEAEGVETRRLNVSNAFHSPVMDPMMEEFGRAVAKVSYARPRISLVSNLTGALAGDELIGPEHWITHIRKPVRFADGIAALHGLGCDVFVEVGPKPTLSRMAQACLPDASNAFLATLHPGQDDWDRALLSLGELFTLGVPVDWRAFDDGYARRRISLPAYPVKGQRYFVDAPSGRNASDSAGSTNGSWLKAIIAARQNGGIGEEIRKSGRFSEEETRLLAGLLDVFVDEYGRRAEGHAPSHQEVVSDYYDTFRNLTTELENTALEDVTEAYLTFAPLPEIIPGYSWLFAMIDGAGKPEWARITLEAQQVLREGVFRKVDFARVKKALDFGCGYASDLCTLAQRHPHLEGTGYTLSAEQLKVAQKKVTRLGLGDRVHVYQRDSTKDEFPEMYDLAFGFEVAHHIHDKHALFTHISRHLNEGGQLCMADFISRTGFSIDYDTMSSYFATTDQWVDLFSESRLLATDCVDISREMANFLYDPDFDRNVEELARRGKADAIHGLKSYDRLGRMHAEGLALYVLLTAEKRSDLSEEELRRRNREVLSEPVPYSEVSIPHGIYEPEWVRSDRAPGSATNGHPARWLVLADRGGVGEALAGRLEAAGQRTVLADCGTSFSRPANNRFVLDPGDSEGFSRLLRETAADGAFRGVIHLWSLDAPRNEALDLFSLRAAQVRGSGSAINLLQALQTVGGSAKPRILLVTEQAQPVGDGPVQVAQTPLLGVGRGIGTESPDLWGGMVDIPDGSMEEKVTAILAELPGPDGETSVAWRGGERYAQRLVRRPRPRSGQPQVSSDASYLVTGGTGGLGLTVARWLVDQGARHLILTSRHGASDDAREEIRSLESRGASVRVATVDVTDERGMRSFFAEMARSGPPLRGVINAAGINGGTVLADQQWDGFNEVLDIKLAGTFLLDELTRGLPLDFFVSFSSVASLLGSAGQSAYVAANAFQDALAHQRARGGLPSLAVNWGPWAEVGMATRMSDHYRKELRRTGVGDIAPREAMEVLGRLIREGRPQTAVVPVNWAKFVRDVGQGPIPLFLSRVAKVPEKTPPSTPVAEQDLTGSIASATPAERAGLVRQLVQQRVAKILGYGDASQVDTEATLLELGFDSLMAVQLRNQIRTALGQDVAIGKLFDSTSIEGLAALLQERLSAKTASREEAPVEAI